MDCKNCKHAIFDELWGEYKCKICERIVYDTRLDAWGCEHYDKKPVEKTEEK